jgi:hypothetical protein
MSTTSTSKSGAEKRKRAKLLEKKEHEFMRKVPKVSSFFGQKRDVDLLERSTASTKLTGKYTYL